MTQLYENKLRKSGDPWRLLYEWVKTDVVPLKDFIALKDYILRYIHGIKDIEE